MFFPTFFFSFFSFFLFTRTCFSQTQAVTPPRGWNSWDSYLWTINESQVLSNAEAIKDLLLPFGYDTLVIDEGWYENSTNLSDPNNRKNVYMDKYGRLLPDPNRYPSAINESGDNIGFIKLAQEIHSMGLKFGIHVMRGIHSKAVELNTPIYGTSNPVLYASQIAVTTKVNNGNEQNGPCPWYSDMLGLNMSVNGSQQYYNSIYSLYAQWGVDFIKNDCIYGGDYAPDQIIATTNSINKSGREMIYSLSPGDFSNPSDKAIYIHNYTNMYRIAGDDWDKYSSLLKHFQVSAQHAQANLLGATGYKGYSWPDNDMLPFGYITTPGTVEGPSRYCNLTYGQQRIQMTLWSIARSPLMFGGESMDLYNDPFTLSLLTNKNVLSLNEYSMNNLEIVSNYDSNNLAITSIWSGYQKPNNNYNINKDTYYVAFFNLQTIDQIMEIQLTDINGFNSNYNTCDSFDVWDGGETLNVGPNLQVNVLAQNVILLMLTNCQ